jgi:hypothetical protein
VLLFIDEAFGVLVLLISADLSLHVESSLFLFLIVSEVDYPNSDPSRLQPGIGVSVLLHF